MMQSRRRFLTIAALAGRRRPRPARPRFAGQQRGALENVHHPPSERAPPSAVLRGYVADELHARGGFHRYPLCRATHAYSAGRSGWARGKIDFGLNYASNYVTAIDAGEPIMLAGRSDGRFATNCSAAKASAGVADLKGKSVGVQGLGSAGNVLVTMMAAPCRARPRQGHPLGHRPRAKSRSSCSCRARSMRFWGSRPSHRSCAPRHIGNVIVKQCCGPPVVPVFLLHAGRAIGNTCSATRVATKGAPMRAPPQGDGPLRPPIRRRVARQLVRWRFSPPRYDYALQTFERELLRQMAGTTTPRTRSASMHCACATWALSNRARQKIIADNTDWRFLNELKREAEGVSANSNSSCPGSTRAIRATFQSAERCGVDLPGQARQ